MSGSVDLGGRRIIKKIFFKQKTAYEIVTGDWSSDVCSSDLPDNATASSLREKFKNGLDAESFVSDIGLEREINVFFRLDSQQVRDGIASSLDLDVADLNDEKTFIGLRSLRDNW